MTSKERAALRAQANKLEVLFQYGKGGLSDALIEATDGALNTRELIKLKVLVETSPDTPRQAADKLSALIKCVEELAQGNREFASARQATERAVREMRLPAADEFLDRYLAAYELPLDEQ